MNKNKIMRKKVAIAGIFHETQTFVDTKTTLSDFRWDLGEDLLQARGDDSPLGGVIEVSDKKEWNLLPIININAFPGGIIADDVIRKFWETLTEGLTDANNKGLDGIYLILHGAMASESYEDIEGETLQRIRKVVGSSLPICGVVDLHCNFTPAMARNSNGLISYCKNPHTDAKEAAQKGATLLDQIMRNKSHFKTYLRNPPIVWPPGGTGTDNDPMKHLENMAREFEKKDSDIYAVNVLAGYSFGDTYHTGLSFSVISMGSQATAEQILTKLCNYAIENKDKGNICELSPLDSALESVKKNTADNGPILLIEPSENVGGGAPGDGTEILRFFIKNKLKNTAVAIADSEAVQAISSVPLGETVELHIGGKMNKQDKGPIFCKAKLLKVTNGRFDLEDPNSHLASALGKHIDMGPSALVEYEGIYILLSSKPIPPFDLAQFRSVGIDPEKLRAIGIKAAIGHKQAYDPIAKGSFFVDTPGPCSSNLNLLPYRKIRRPIFPLDKI